MKSWVILMAILVFQLGSCTAMAGSFEPWPAMLVAVILIIALKIWNDRGRVLGFPMELLMLSTVIMIVVNLGRLYVTPMPF